MDIRLIGITLTLAVIKQSFGLPIGCSYNGTSYKDGDSIKAKDPCLSCSCRIGALVCNLRVCATPPDPLPQNCFLVHKENECCPHMLCEENYNGNGIELRTAFKPKKTIERNDCMINGTVFAEGSAVGSPHLCEYCYCLKGKVQCLKPRCSHNFKDCKPIYHESFCCPTHYDCRIPADSKLTKLNNYGCTRNGTVFLEGDMVPSVNNSGCDSCYCMKGEIVCTPITCQIEPDLKDCQPLNTKDQCCPTAFNCASNFSNPEENSETEFQKLLTETKPFTLASQNNSDFDIRLTTTEKQFVLETSTAILEMESTTNFITTGLEKYEINLTESQNNNAKVEMMKKAIVTAENIAATSPGTTQTSLNITEKILSRNSEKLDPKNRAEETETDLLYGDIFRNSSLHSDDYDTYDYNEPKLPPSLPNLVIYPFVAADAVVKDTTETKTDTLEPSNIKKADISPGYYSNFFSSPIQGEGGFEIKDIPHFSSHSYEYFNNKKTSKFPSSSKDKLFSDAQGFLPLKNGKCFVDGKEIWHGETLPETEECLSCACQHGEIICREITCESLEPGCVRVSDKKSCCGTILCDSGTSENIPINDFSIIGSENPLKLSDPFEEVIKTEVAPDLSQFSDFPDSVNPYTIKPVTVTYKNVVVDYYPEFSVTSLRSEINMTTEKNIVTESALNSYISPSSTFYSTSEKVSTEDHLANSKNSVTVTAKPSFLDELFKSWLGEDIKYTTTVPTAVTKFKYSSKIKTDLEFEKKNPTNEVVIEKIKELENEKANISDPSLLDQPLIQKKYTTHNGNPFDAALKTPRPLKIDPPPFKDQNHQLLSNESKNDSKKNKKNEENEQKTSSQAEGSTNNFTTFLKLAGCNIYGRMYRVGKIIAELSGPCMECICTNSGVQCNSLPCSNSK